MTSKAHEFIKRTRTTLLGAALLLALGSLRAQYSSRQSAVSAEPPAGKAGRLTDTTPEASSTKDTTANAPAATTLSPATRADSTKPTADAGMPIKYTQARDTALQVKDTAVKDTPASDAPAKDAQVKDTTAKDTTPPAPNSTDLAQNSAKQDASQPKDSAADKKDEPSLQADAPRQLDKRWFISPLIKVQFQDFGLLEKNRKGYLSDANTLPFFQRGNGSFAASAYKNLTGRLSMSADIGLSFGHVTNDNVLISQTKKQTFNLLNATIYYHLLPASYRLQPYITAGINDIINSASYASAPVGIGAKFNARKVMVLGQVTYGMAVSKNISNTMMYGLGIYIPIKNKKQKKAEEEDKSPYNRNDKKKDKDKDSTSGRGNGGGVVNNIYITINMDSVLRAKGLLNDDGSGSNGGGSGRRRKGDDDYDDDNGSGSGNDANGSHSHRSGKHKKGLRSTLHLDDDLTAEDFKVDTINGLPVIRFIVYFEFNEYSLTSHAFNNIDKMIAHLQNKPELSIEIKGYTDDVGSDQYNNFLSRRRAKMVLDYMNSRGVPSELMQAKAYGSDNPVADNKDPNQAWLNRRAEIIVHEK